MLSEENNFTEEEARDIVEKVLTSPDNFIEMLTKYGDRAVHRINHGQLHLDFDDRENSSWNDDIINKLPLYHPVTITSWKGIIYVHSLDYETIDCNCLGTREILVKIMTIFGDKRQLNRNIKY